MCEHTADEWCRLSYDLPKLGSVITEWCPLKLSYPNHCKTTILQNYKRGDQIVWIIYMMMRFTWWVHPKKEQKDCLLVPGQWTDVFSDHQIDDHKLLSYILSTLNSPKFHLPGRNYNECIQWSSKKSFIQL